MNKGIVVLLLAMLFVFHAFAQQKDTQRITDSIVNEGKALYRSEFASWFGTDIFLAKCANKRELIGGYLSYDTPTGLNNVFYSKGDDPFVLGTTSFGKDFVPENYTLDTTKRTFTKAEKELFTMRAAVIKRMGTDTIFKYYKNTRLNPIPIITNGEKKVYILTGPGVNGVVVFGNDYLVNLDDKYQITTINRLHKNIITAYYKNTQDNNSIQDSTKREVAGMHSHLPTTGDFITATDICTLMLYEKFTTWNQYYIMSKNYISIWDCKKNDLVVLTMEAWKRIADDQAKRHPKQ
ncbi:hypothetical protein [Mucilaginibacter flavus]|uniref:hypothetical protein n=1 Tax=Mucilaginibacter flavus TaxID=931504 RepID=UPI0025B49302|nr:hypothetical protein [Mucilaginibacter flavus]MDN3582323.1 hypothetical protein [Mucilaginibacter flavus]